MAMPLDVPTKAEAELEALIGLSEVKQVVKKMLALVKLNQRYQRRGQSRQQYMHMAFLGNPGTAKTTVAKIIGKILHEYGVLRKSQILEVGRDGLVGRYIGSTAPKTVEAFDKARGSILFIDEAYSLNDAGRGDYGDEALATIVKEMENRGGDPIVIMAGYPAEMEGLLHRNAGLMSRIKFVVNFPDYSAEELFEIVLYTARKYNYALGEGVREKLMPLIEKAKGDANFGNGRWVRNLIEAAELNLASRLIKISPDEITDNLRDTMLPEDFEDLPDVKLRQAPRRPIGFTAERLGSPE